MTAAAYADDDNLSFGGRVDDIEGNRMGWLGQRRVTCSRLKQLKKRPMRSVDALPFRWGRGDLMDAFCLRFLWTTSRQPSVSGSTWGTKALRDGGGAQREAAMNPEGGWR
jgi:hypothetical protein